MDKRVLFSTYQLTVCLKNGRDNQFLDQFNASDNDLFPLLVSFFQDLYSNPRDGASDEGKSGNLQFTLNEPAVIDIKNRIVYGRFESGFIGQRLKIKDRVDRTTAFTGDKSRHTNVSELFFFIRMPMRSREAYCVLQRKSHYGLKTSFHSEFKKWVSAAGFSNITINLKPSLPGSVFHKMLNEGALKQIEFIINRIPGTLDKLHQRDLDDNSERGKFITLIQSPFSLSDHWKNFVRNQYFLNFSNSNVTIDPAVEYYQEITFSLELNGKIKKFYARQKSKTLPDIDVSEGMSFDPDDEPSIKSLVEKSQEVISDVFGKEPVVIDSEQVLLNKTLLPLPDDSVKLDIPSREKTHVKIETDEPKKPKANSKKASGDVSAS